jgi:regulator of protease activity HflC (stomatin/prohibitin superfamily)
VKQSTTLVVFRFGICIGAKGPGLVLTFPIIDKWELVELKVDHNKIPGEACITKDNVQIKVDFVYYWQIKDAVKSVTEVTNATDATRLLATGALRAVIASFTFSDLQEQRQDLNKKLQNEIDVYSSRWGIYVTNVEIQEVKTSDEIRRAMEDWRAAKWRSESMEILAKGEAEALKKLYAVANIIDSNTLNLKYFEMLSKLGQAESTKYIFPMELSNLIQSWTKKDNGDQGDKKSDHPLEQPSGTYLANK